MDTWREHLIEARKRLGLSVIEVARRLGVDRGTVYRWENGGRTPELEHLRAWGAVLGVGVDVSIVVPLAHETPAQELLRRLRSSLDTLDERSIRLLAAQLDVLAPEDVKKVS